MEKIFGNSSQFAIQFKPIKNSERTGCLHLILGGQLIGDQNESTLISSWINKIELIRNILIFNFNKLSHKEFNRKDDEIWELIWKSNQLKEEYNPIYEYLPALDNEIWYNCHISLNETTDAWLIAMIQENGRLKFMWKGWREPCPAFHLGKLYSTIIEREFAIKTIDECILFLNSIK